MTYPPQLPVTFATPLKTPGFAIASMATGVAGLVLAICLAFFPVLPILAIVFGYLALARINRELLPGRAMAITGLITGYIGLAVSALLLILIAIGTFSSPTPNF